MQAATNRWERRPDERPQELLDAALGVFATRGYRATKLDEIAEAAGVSKGTIYYYFDSKADLLVQSLRSKVQAALGQVEAELAKHPDATAEARIRLALQTGWSRWSKPEFGQIYRLLIGEVAGEFPDVLESWIKEGPVRAWHLLARLIAEGQASGEFSSTVAPLTAARLMISGLMHQALLLIHLRCESTEGCDPSQMIEPAIDFLIGGLHVPAASPQANPL